ncbi:hypothetical protein [Aliikangiella sp. IMCC44632]
MLILIRLGLLFTVVLSVLGCSSSEDSHSEKEAPTENSSQTAPQAAIIGTSSVSQVAPKQSQPLSQAAAITPLQVATETYEVPNRFPTPKEREEAQKNNQNKTNTSTKPDPIN